MPFVDYLKRLLGISDSGSENNTRQHERSDALNRQKLQLDVKEYEEPFTPYESDHFLEEHINQLENFLRNLPSFGFPFGFGSPDHHANDPPHHPMSPFGPPHPDSGGFSIFGFPSIFDFGEGRDGPARPPHSDSGRFSIFGFPSIFDFGDGHKGTFDPSVQQERLSARDEVLKPSYRSTSHQQFKDEDYDALVRERGPEVILDILNKPEVPERRMVPTPDTNQIVPRVSGHFVSTRFSFVNGESVKEQLTRLPDGTFEKRVTKTDANGETKTVVSHHTQEEIAPTMRGGFGQIPGFGGFGGFGGLGGFGPTLW